MDPAPLSSREEGERQTGAAGKMRELSRAERETEKAIRLRRNLNHKAVDEILTGEKRKQAWFSSPRDGKEAEIRGHRRYDDDDDERAQERARQA